MPVTFPTDRPFIPDPSLNESLEQFSPSNHMQGLWTAARKVAVCFLAFVGVCVLLQMIRASSRSSRVDNGDEKDGAVKKTKTRAAAKPSTITCDVSNGTTRYSNAPGTSVIKDFGVQKQEELRLPFFNAIEIRLPAIVKIEKGPQRVTLAADKNIFDVLVAKVEGVRLILEAKPHTAFETRQPINYTIAVPSLTDLKVTTAAKVSILKQQEASFRCQVEDNSEVDIQGQVTTQDITLRGSGMYGGRYLTTDHSKVHVSAAGKAHVKAVHTLTITVEDNGKCTYYGEPVSPLQKKITGNGKVFCQIDIYQEV
jgi:hypothetical protein